jgi:DNA polymerase-1
MTAEMVGISLATEPGLACYIPMAHRYQGAPEQLPRDLVLEKLKAWLEDPKPSWARISSTTAHIFANHGVSAARHRARHAAAILCVRVAPLARHGQPGAAPPEPQDHGLPTCAARAPGQICFDQVDIDRATEYAAEDADITLRLHQAMHGARERGRG